MPELNFRGRLRGMAGEHRKARCGSDLPDPFRF
jgi:hypothetical protein